MYKDVLKTVNSQSHLMCSCVCDSSNSCAQPAGTSTILLLPWLRCYRSEILTDSSLKISRVRVMDEGLYVCRAENSVGYVEAMARLTVHCK